MTHDEVVHLLQIVSTYDSRKLDHLTVAAWKEAASRARWTSDAALEAVHEHYSKSTAWLMPGHVTELVRAGKRHPAPVDEVLSIAAAPPASPERRAELMAQIRKLADSKAVPPTDMHNTPNSRPRRSEGQREAFTEQDHS